jgi:hypothetical protein
MQLFPMPKDRVCRADHYFSSATVVNDASSIIIGEKREKAA